MKNVIIVGVGEVGSAIEKLERENGNDLILFDDKLEAPQNIPDEIDVMHISIPFIKNFVNTVIEYVNTYKPKITIINSTIKPGTTDYIKEFVKTPVVHSPIRGIHPNLYEGIKTFVKFIGGNPEDCKLAQDHFESFGIKTSNMTSKESEFLKLIDTTYYGWNIAFAKYINDMCEENGLNYENVYTKANITYNEGYTKLGKSNVVRPVLFPPKDGVGGHCISSNCLILHEYSPELCNEILKVGKDSKDPLNDKDWLYCEYVTKNTPMSKIAKELNVSKQHIVRKLIKYNIYRQ